jgi:hypothetical protein
MHNEVPQKNPLPKRLKKQIEGNNEKDENLRKGDTEELRYLTLSKMQVKLKI